MTLSKNLIQQHLRFILYQSDRLHRRRRNLLVLFAALVLLVSILASSVMDVAFAQALPAIFLELRPSSQEVQAGSSAAFNATVIPLGNWGTGNVTLAVVNPPKGVTAMFSPEKRVNITAKAFASVLTVNISPDAPVGKTTLTIRGTGYANWNGTKEPAPLDATVDAELSTIGPPCIGKPPSDGSSRAAYVDYTAEPYLAQAASKSDLVVLGTVTGINDTTILGDGTVYTHYLFLPSTYLKGLSLDNHQIILSKLGGTCGSYTMTAIDDFKINVGEQYVLFISTRTGQNGVVNGWQGIYPVIDGKIYSMLSAGRGGPDISTSRMVDGWSLEQFKAEIEKQIIVTTSTQTTTETFTVIVNGTSLVTSTTQTTTTVVTSTETTAATSTYAWALSAILTIAVLAVVLLLRRKHAPSGQKQGERPE